MGGTPAEKNTNNNNVKLSTKDKRIINFITISKRSRSNNNLYMNTKNLQRNKTQTNSSSSSQQNRSVSTDETRSSSSSNKKKNGFVRTKSLQQLSSQSVSPPALMFLEMEISSSDESGSEDLTHDTTSCGSSSCSFTENHPRNSFSAVEPHIATKVQFTTVEVRSYNVTIGDHPCCTVGCPITLDWDYTIINHDVPIDEYEIEKQNHCMTVYGATKRLDLRISPEERVELLLACAQKLDEANISETHLSELEIRRASRKFHRTKNCSTRQCERIHETFFHCPLQHRREDDDDDENDDE